MIFADGDSYPDPGNKDQMAEKAERDAINLALDKT